MTTTVHRGIRGYSLLVPLSIPREQKLGEPVAEYLETITMKPCTWDLTERWASGALDHAKGPLYALMEEVTGLPWSTLGRLQYPDADLFLAEFMQHLPSQIRADIADGRMPERVVRAPFSGDDAPAPAPGEPEPVYFDPTYAAEPLTAGEAPSIPEAQRGFGIDLEDG